MRSGFRFFKWVVLSLSEEKSKKTSEINEIRNSNLVKPLEITNQFESFGDSLSFRQNHQLLQNPSFPKLAPIAVEIKAKGFHR